MPHDIGPMLDADEGLNHQIVNTFGTTVTADLSWTEKIWITLFRKDGSLQIDAGVGKYPNRNVIDAFGGMSRGREQWTVRASRELASGPEDASVGPLRYDVVEPKHAVRFVLDENDVAPLRYDLLFTSHMPPFFEDRHVDREHYRIVSDVVRYHQPGTVSGWIDVDGVRVDVDPHEWHAFRDHSWGVRQQVGARPGDLAPPPVPRGFHMQWCPMYFTRPDGTCYEVQYYFIEVDGESRHFTGHVNHADGSQTRIVRVEPRVCYDPRHHHLVGGEVVITTDAGERRTIELEPLSETGFHLQTANYFRWNEAWHGTWRGPLHVDGEQIEDCDERMSAAAAPSWQLRDRCLRVREGDNHGFGILEHVYLGDELIGR